MVINRKLSLDHCLFKSQCEFKLISAVTYQQNFLFAFWLHFSHLLFFRHHSFFVSLPVSRSSLVYLPGARSLSIFSSVVQPSSGPQISVGLLSQHTLTISPSLVDSTLSFLPSGPLVVHSTSHPNILVPFSVSSHLLCYPP